PSTTSSTHNLSLHDALPIEDTKDTADKEEKTSQDDNQTSAETTGKPMTNLQDIFSEAVQRTINFFSNREANVTALGDSLTQGVGDRKSTRLNSSHVSTSYAG